MYQYIIKNERAIYRDLLEGHTIEIPRSCSAGMYEVKDPPALSGKNACRDAMMHPVDCERLYEIARKKGAKTAAVIVSDATRQVPTSMVSDLVVDELVAAGVPIEGITFFVALGVHREATAQEMESFVGSDLFQRVHIENHDPYTPEKLIDLGFTSRNTPVKLNKKAYNCDIKITIGKVELHDMAGFSGGRKSILPGIASEETIVFNHRPEVLFHPKASAGILTGNPAHEDMLETAKMFGVDFSINFVVNNSGALSGVYTGSLEGSHKAATDFLAPYVDLPLPEKPDLFVITPGAPFHIELYQGIKALFALKHVVGSDTVVLLYGDFPEGVNSEDFLKPLRMFQDLSEAKEWTLKNYRIQMDTTLPLIDLLEQGVKIVLCTTNISEEDAAAMRMTLCEDFKEAFAVSQALTGKNSPRTMFCPHPQRGVVHYASSCGC